MKAARLATLQAQEVADRQAFNRKLVGEETTLLLERKGRLPGQLVGKTPWLQAVQIDGTGVAIGDTVAVRITQAGTNTLFGELLNADVRPPEIGPRAWLALVLLELVSSQRRFHGAWI